MQIILQHERNNEVEVIIKGDSTSEEIKRLVSVLSDSGLKKIPKKIIGKTHEKEFVLSVTDIETFYTKNNGVYASYNGNDYKVGFKLFELEEMYSCYGIRRISKGVLLNCNFITYLEVEFSGNYTVATKTNNKLTISRNYVKNVKQFIKEEM